MNYRHRDNMDRSGSVQGQWVAPSLLLTVVDKLLAGVPIVEVWEFAERKITYRTLARYKKNGRDTPRYRMAKWWLEHRERVEKLRNRGLSWNEIFLKTGGPPPMRGGGRLPFNLANVCRTFEAMESAEANYWAGRHAA